MDRTAYFRAVRLGDRDPLHVDTVVPAVHAGHLPLLTPVATTHDPDGVPLSQGERTRVADLRVLEIPGAQVGADPAAA